MIDDKKNTKTISEMKRELFILRAKKFANDRSFNYNLISQKRKEIAKLLTSMRGEKRKVKDDS